MPDMQDLVPGAEERGLYGREYFDGYQRRLGLPPIGERAQTDLQERCLHWLRTVLKYQTPPARSLEIGCSHGGFVALLRWAGFDAMGLELSPWAVDFARSAFDVPVLTGPLENQKLEPESLDAVLMLDVLEHLPEPLATLTHAVRLLKPTGILVIQTPQFPVVRNNIDELNSTGSPFLKMLLPEQHLFLFSTASVSELLRCAGAPYVAFEQAIFEYDMFLAASRQPLSPRSSEMVASALLQSPASRLVKALLDLEARHSELARRYGEAEADRGARLLLLEENGRRLSEIESQRQLLARQLDTLSAQPTGSDAMAQILEARTAHLLEVANERKSLADQCMLLRNRLEEVENTAKAREAAIAGLEKQLIESEADRRARLDVIAAQGRQVAEGESQRQALAVECEFLRERLREAEMARADEHAALAGLKKQLIESEADRRARLDVIAAQGRQVAEGESQRQALAAECEFLRERLREAEMARAAAEDALRGSEETALRDAARFRELLTGLEADRDRWATVAEVRQQECTAAEEQCRRQQSTLAAASEVRVRLEGEFARLAAVQSRLRQSHVYRSMRAAGLWSWLEPPAPVLSRREPQGAGAAPTEPLHVVADLTPVLPGGENGGAKVMTLELLQQLALQTPQCRFTLLTNTKNHAELASMECENVQCVCIDSPVTSAPALSAGTAMLRRLGRLLPATVCRRLNRTAQAVRSMVPRPGQDVLRELHPDLLFCPFTAPYFYDPGVPVVSVIYDLQYVFYPHFFSPEECAGREQAFRDATRVSSRVVTISDYVRNTVIERAGLPPDRVVTIHIALKGRLLAPPADVVNRVLQEHALTAGRFLLYPANFWRHKNHEMLLTAFGMFCAGQPSSDVKLVLTGAPGARQEEIRQAVGRMGLSRRVVLPGYVPDLDMAALLESCLAVIFPSLYEGFGIPVVEAMAFGKPVLCSNVTSLPEVAADAAILFDPRKTTEIAGAIARICSDPDLAARMAEQGRRRAAAFAGPSEMAAAYWRVFCEVVTGPRVFSTGLHGVQPDGWSGVRAVVTYSAGPKNRKLVIQLAAPDWIPTDSMVLTVSLCSNTLPEVHTILRGQPCTLELPLPASSGFIELACRPVFRPSDCGLGADSRLLGLMWRSCRIEIPGGGAEEIYWSRHD